MQPDVDIIVPFYKAPQEMIENFLTSISNQTYPHEKLHLIMVDNNEEAQQVVISEYDYETVVLHCKTPGSYAARNYAVHRSCHELIVFSDIDCRPSKDWITCATNGMTNKSIAGGAIRVVCKNPYSPSLCEDFDRRTHLSQHQYILNGFAATANLLVWRDVFYNVGDFESGFFSGGDEQWCKKANYEIAYIDDAIVFHPARIHLSSIIKKNRRGCGSYFGRLSLPNYVACIKSIVYEIKVLRNRWNRLWECDYKTSVVRKIGLTILFGIVETSRICEYIKLGLGGNPERE